MTNRYREFYELREELVHKGKRFDKETLKLLSYRDLTLAGIGNAGPAACDYRLVEEEQKSRIDAIVHFSFEDVEKDKGKWDLLDDISMYWAYYKAKSKPLVITKVPMWRLLVKQMMDLRGDWSNGRENSHLKLIYQLLLSVENEGIVPLGWIKAVKMNADDFDGEFNDGRIMRDGKLRLPKEVADAFNFPNTDASGNIAKLLGAKPEARSGGYKGSYTELFEDILVPEDKVIFVSELIEDKDDKWWWKKNMEIKMNPDQKIWSSIAIISYMLVFGILIAEGYGIIFNYGGYFLILVFLSTLISFFMYSITRYMTTKEFVSIFIEKIKHNKINSEQKVWFLIFIVSFISVSEILIRATHGIRYNYDIYFLVFGFVIAFVSFIMSCMTQYIQTKEILSIFTEKQV